jgi:hypothetical protein
MRLAKLDAKDINNVKIQSNVAIPKDFPTYRCESERKEQFASFQRTCKSFAVNPNQPWKKAKAEVLTAMNELSDSWWYALS